MKKCGCIFKIQFSHYLTKVPFKVLSFFIIFCVDIQTWRRGPWFWYLARISKFNRIHNNIEIRKDQESFLLIITLFVSIFICPYCTSEQNVIHHIFSITGLRTKCTMPWSIISCKFCFLLVIWWKDDYDSSSLIWKLES